MSIAPTKHYRLGPSGSSRWLVCPGSAVDDLPETSNEASRAGNDDHERAGFKLEHGLPTFGKNTRTAAVNEYLAFVESLPGRKEHERQFVSNIVEGFGGTVDTLVLHERSLHIVDFKSGKWKVKAKDNTQLGCYLVLAREHYSQGFDPPFDSYTATIVQPAVYAKPQTAVFTTQDLDRLQARIIMAAGSTELKAGNHCWFCPLRPTCSVGQEYAKQQRWPN